ncbi:MAG: conserved protein of unknown function [Nitrospira sp.]
MNTRQVIVAVCAAALMACAGPKPILYPNAHLQSVGTEAAEADIKNCRQMAESAGADEATGKAGGVAKSTAVGAGIGAASGAVGGAITGSPGMGAAIGAASGATWGFLMGLFTSKSQGNPAYTNFVNRCLQEKGYEVTGWN